VFLLLTLGYGRILMWEGAHLTAPVPALWTRVQSLFVWSALLLWSVEKEKVGINGEKKQRKEAISKKRIIKK
jgi:hypothetical protein